MKFPPHTLTTFVAQLTYSSRSSAASAVGTIFYVFSCDAVLGLDLNLSPTRQRALQKKCYTTALSQVLSYYGQSINKSKLSDCHYLARTRPVDKECRNGKTRAQKNYQPSHWYNCLHSKTKSSINPATNITTCILKQNHLSTQSLILLLAF